MYHTVAFIDMEYFCGTFENSFSIPPMSFAYYEIIMWEKTSVNKHCYMSILLTNELFLFS